MPGCQLCLALRETTHRWAGLAGPRGSGAILCRAEGGVSVSVQWPADDDRRLAVTFESIINSTASCHAIWLAYHIVIGVSPCGAKDWHGILFSTTVGICYYSSVSELETAPFVSFFCSSLGHSSSHWFSFAGWCSKEGCLYLRLLAPANSKRLTTIVVDPVLPELGIVVHFSLCFPLQPFESATSLLLSLEWAFLFKYIQFQSSATRGHVMSHLFFLSVPNRAWWLSVSWLNCTPNQPFLFSVVPVRVLLLLLFDVFWHALFSFFCACSCISLPILIWEMRGQARFVLDPWHTGTFQIIFFPFLLLPGRLSQDFATRWLVWMRTDYLEVIHHFRVIALFHISKNLLRVCNSLNFSMSFNCLLTGELRDVIHIYWQFTSQVCN